MIDPGETLSTVTGTNAQPVNAQDPFAIGLTNVSDQSLDGFIEEEPCDGSQEGPLCGTPRVGGVAGNFVFTAGRDRAHPSPYRRSGRRDREAVLRQDHPRRA